MTASENLNWKLKTKLKTSAQQRKLNENALYWMGGLVLKLQYFGHLLWRADSLEKTLMLGKEWRQEEKRATEDEMVGWHRWLNGHECEQTPGDGEGQGSLACCIHGVAKSRTRLSDFTLTFHFHALEKEMATHSSVLAWRIPGTGEPGGLPSMGSHRVGHDWSDLAAN